MFLMDRLNNYLARNKWARRAFYGFALIFCYFLYKWTFVPMIGWDGVAILIAMFTTMMGASLGILAAIGWGFYHFVIRSARRHAHKLREMGYGVWINEREIYELSVSFIVFLLLTVLVFLFGQMTYSGYTSNVEYGVTPTTGWWAFALGVGGALFFCWVSFGWVLISTWWRSFRPLRMYYKRAKAGEQIEELPPLIE